MSEKVLMDDRFMAKREAITGACALLKQIEAIRFANTNGFNSFVKTGVSGQSVKKAVPEAVEVDGMGYHYVELEQLIPVLVAAVNELSAKVNTGTVTRKATKAAE